jgi:hypothetical protein
VYTAPAPTPITVLALRSGIVKVVEPSPFPNGKEGVCALRKSESSK